MASTYCSPLDGKGVPAPLAAVFLLTAPVVNPVVGLATHFAFMNQPEFVFWRLGGATSWR
nr:hypothetical protein [Desulforamulus aquiferis]